MSVPSSKAELSQSDTTKLATRLAILGPALAQIAFVLELTLVPVLLPSMQADLGLSLLETASVFNAYSIAMAAGIFVCAVGGDTFRTSQVFSLGVVMFLIGAVLIYMAASTSALIAGRICQGFGAGMFSPLVPVLLTKAAPDRPGRTLILWGSTAGYIAAFAPLVYGSVVNEVNWALAFLIIAVVAALSLLGICSSQRAKDPLTAAETVTSYRAIFEARELWMTFVYIFATYGAITFFLFRIPLSLADKGTDAASIGVVMSVLWLSFSILSALLRNLVDNNRLWLIMVSAPVLIAVGVMLAFSSHLLVVAIAACLVGCGLACSNAPSTQMVLRFAPRGLTALATSIDISAARFGGIVTVAALAEMSVRVSVVTVFVFGLLAIACAHVVAKTGAGSA